MEKGSAYDLLKKLGVVERKGYLWSLCHVEGVRGQEEEIWKYLGRHGLPEEAKSELEEKETLLALELRIAEVYEDQNKDTM
jgi:hypothetical protein